MAQDIVNANQNLSYTNLDFSSIYTEVLDMVKQLTKNWDPSISDESDPGVVLVKLSALLADKMNYNIDKNILEAFPLSVTQDSNARQMYEQLGYYMSWYKAATAPVTLTWKTDTVNTDGEIISYTIPKFTTITDENETVVYTLVGTESEDEIVVSDGLLYTDSSKNLNMIAYEGIPVQYTFNDRTTITPNMVDNQNRLYLTTAYAFENGIFIKNVEQDNYAEWHRVNNLYEYSYDVHRYKFGYDSAANLCYLEFPDNYAELFGSGIEIVYLTFSTSESYSDVPTQYLSKFLVPLNVGELGDVTLTSEVVSISNTAPASGHAEKEGIDEAYTNYKKVVGTFKTLITLRDYLNYIRSKEVDICSNAKVTDRTNDVQSTYKIVSEHNGVDSLITEVEKSSDNFKFKKVTDEDIYLNKTYYTIDINGNYTVVNNPQLSDIGIYYEKIGEDVLSPFSLKFYILQKAIALTNRLAYDNTFELSTENINLDTLLEHTSHLVHNFNDILPIGTGKYALTSDSSVQYDDNGIPSKIYFRYNAELNRYEPVIITSMDFQSYNPAAMGLYEQEIKYIKTADTVWNTNRTYYIHAQNEYAEFTQYTTAPYNNMQPRYTTYIWEVDNVYYSSDIYVQSVEYVKTTDTTLDANKIHSDVSEPYSDYYEYNPESHTYEDVYAKLPDSESTSSINPAHLGLYEQIEEPLLSHIVMFKNKYPLSMNIATYNTVSRAVKQDILSNIYSALYKNLDSSNIEFGDNISLDYLTHIVTNADTRIKSVTFEALTYTTSAIYWDEAQQSFIEIDMPKSISDIQLNNLYLRPTYDDFTSYLFGKDIICKSILAGTTQLLIPDNIFAYHLNQKYIQQQDNIKYITGEAIINIQNQSPYYVISDGSHAQVRRTYTLQENETLTLFKPLINNVETYTAGVHYEYRIFSNIVAGQSYQLQKGEYFIFYISNLNSDGLLQSFNVYVYGENAIINPSFAIEVRNSLSEYGNVAVNMMGENAQYISKDSNLYSYVESRSNFVVQINNDSVISNTKIDTNQTLNAQTLRVFTLNAQDGYRFIWSLNKPTYEGTLKQYKLFDAYNPSDDIELQNISTINSYTLKSGEFLYYTDSTLSNLGILGAGTTIYRNCGLESDIVPIINVDPVVYVKWVDLVNSTSEINAQGFDKIISTVNNTNVILPIENGFYYKDGDEFKRITENQSSLTINDYYIMLMKDVSGWYVFNEDNTTSLVSINSSETFSLIDLAEEYPNQDVNPQAEGLYERIEYNGVPLQDDYYKPTKACNDSDDYINGKVITTNITSNRYAQALEESVLTSQIITNTSGNTISTTSPVGNILIDTSDTTRPYSPSSNNWMIYDEESDKYVYATASDTLFTSALSNINYQSDMSVVTDMNTLYYKLHEQSNLWQDYKTLNTNTSYLPMLSTGYVDNGGGLYGNNVYSLSRLFVNTNISQGLTYLKNQINSGWAHNNVVSDNVSDWNLKMFNDSNTTWTHGNNVPSSIVNPYVCLTYADFNNVTLNDVNKSVLRQNIQIGFVWDSDTLKFTIKIFMLLTEITKQLSFGSFTDGAEYNLYTLDANWYPLSYTTINDNTIYDSAGVGISVPNKANIYDIISTLNVTELTGYYLDADRLYSLDAVTTSVCCNLYTNLSALISCLEALQGSNGPFKNQSYEFGLYFLPKYYNMRPWVGYISKKFYRLNKYATKTYAQVDPLVCPAIDSLLLSNNPLSVMKTAFQSVQPNTSLTFTQNELQTLSQGDSISFETLESSSPLIMFPTFSNNEVTLNLNDYKVTYKRVGNDVESLDKIQVENCDWKGYSNLLLNTNSANGQKLSSNHTITMYDSDFTSLGTVSGQSDSNVHFQLQYPMSNVSGTFVDVSTVNIVQSELLNTLYAYNVSQPEENYAYAEDNFNTYVYVKKADISGDYTFNPGGVEINNIKLAPGEYLIPINGLSGKRIELYYDDNVPEITVDSTLESSQFSLNNNVLINRFGTEYGSYKFIYKVSENTLTITRNDVTILEEICTPELLSEYGIVIDGGVTGINWEIGIEYSLSQTQQLQSYVDGKNYFLGDKLFFAHLTVPNVSVMESGTIRVRVCKPNGDNLDPTNDETITVVLNDIFKFEPNALLNGIFNEIKTKIQELDVDQLYNYTHIPADDDLIQDPLVPKEYWNKHHIVNPFTIAQLDADNIEYKFLT